jgi:hypothetical protein
MPISDIYTGSGTVTASTTSATPLCSLITPATKRAFIVGIRIGIGATSYIAGNALFQLLVLGNAGSVTLGTSGTVTNDLTNTAIASLASFKYAGGTAYGVAPTTSTSVLWQQELPQTTGSSWEEFPPLGYEYVVPVSVGVGIFVTAAGTAASQTYNVEIIWSE